MYNDPRIKGASATPSRSRREPALGGSWYSLANYNCTCNPLMNSLTNYNFTYNNPLMNQAPLHEAGSPGCRHRCATSAPVRLAAGTPRESTSPSPKITKPAIWSLNNLPSPQASRCKPSSSVEPSTARIKSGANAKDLFSRGEVGIVLQKGAGLCELRDGLVPARATHPLV